ncbi:MAG: hypothetical protein OQK09_07520 [Colwellia sp.]|nr:hypothetical protein [Colwellia sp.]MCW9081348.1 hypothetical protein [Colwellia sp.]
MTLSISVACGLFDRTEALFNGDVKIEGCHSTFLHLSAEETFFRAFSHAEFDIAELSFSSYLIELSKGYSDYIALPVFLGRSFRHNGIYVRNDRIKSPQDLKGARVGVPEYQVTAAVWIRGILEDEFAIHASDINWFTGGVEQAGRKEKVSIEIPENISIQAIADTKTLSQMLVDGEIDALIAPRAPSCFLNGSENIDRLFPNYVDVESDYYQRTGIFPIMHVLGIRRSLVEQHPWLPSSVTKAFEQARLHALPRLKDTTASLIMLPWLSAELERTQKIMGDDFWRYGVSENIATLESLVRYSHDQGLTSPKLEIDELFAAGSTTVFKV